MQKDGIQLLRYVVSVLFSSFQANDFYIRQSYKKQTQSKNHTFSFQKGKCEFDKCAMCVSLVFSAFSLKIIVCSVIPASCRKYQQVSPVAENVLIYLLVL